MVDLGRKSQLDLLSLVYGVVNLFYFFVNEYIWGFGLGFGDLDLGCGEVLWKSGEGVGFCCGMGLWKSGRGCLGRIWCAIWRV